MGVPANELTSKPELGSISSFTLDYKPNPLTSMQLVHLSTGELTLEGEFNLWQSDDKQHTLGVYKKSELGAETNINTTMHMVYNFGQNYFFNFGLKNYPICETSSAPTTFSVGTIARFLEDKNLSSWAGLHLDFNLRNVSDVKFQLGVSNPNANGVLQLQVERKIEPQVSLSDGKISSIVTYPKTLRLGLEARVSDDFSLFNVFESAIEDTKLKTDLTFGGLYTFDPYTNLKFKFKDDLTTTVSITRRFRNLFDFTFSTNLVYKTYSALERKTSTTPLLSHVKSKFGVTLNLLDESLL
jgi:hypothetical protein